MASLADLSAIDMAAAIAEGQHSSEDIVAACLQRINEVEPAIQAFAFLDPEHALKHARDADSKRRTGRPVGPLHGVPVGIKDIIDTAGMPTENGTVLDAGRRPRNDAAVVRMLRSAGAVILGKTVTTELAYFAPSKTKNPHDPGHSPGGSSAGSAAAVASGMLPLAVGTQTNGSMIRPASFCGTVGYKPSWGMIPRTGILAHDHHLDTVGVFARSVADAALLADSLIGEDPGDPATRPIASQRLREAAKSAPPLLPTFAFVRSPVWDRADATTQQAFSLLADALGAQCDLVDLPESFARAHDCLRTLMLSGFAHRLGGYYQRASDQLSVQMREAIEAGQRMTAKDYLAAVDWIAILNGGLERIFERYDAILTPAAPGIAPKGFETTGDPVFCSLWQFCGTPAICLPLLQGENGMPIGVQLVARRGDDHRLIRSAAWLSAKVAEMAVANHA